MPRIEIEANELHGTSANLVSLVKRGAIRVPFRFTKGDDSMLDLQKIGASLFNKADTVAPVVIAAIVRKNADCDDVKDRLNKAGLATNSVEDRGDIMLYKQDVTVPKNANEAILKLDNDIALVVSGLAKAFDGFDFESMSFTDVQAIEGFYPSMRLATDLLGSTMSNIMQKADSPAEAATALTTAIGEFQSYINQLAGVIPVHAFKADMTDLEKGAMIGNKKKNKKTTGAEDDGSFDDNVMGDSDAKDMRSKVKKGEKPEDDKTDEPAEGAEAIEKSEDADADKSDEIVENIQKSMEAALTSAMSDLTAMVKSATTAIQTDVSALSDRMAAAEAAVKKTAEDVAGTALSSPDDDKTGGSNRVQKSSAPPPLDTAFYRDDEAA